VIKEFNIYIGLIIIMITSLHDMKLLQEKAENDEEELDDDEGHPRSSLDFINESLAFYTSFLNMFVKILRILLEEELKKKKKEMEERQQQQQQQQQQRVRRY